ncbi:MAG: hypothetical protein ACE37K_17930 [Planctomycetota bacterium]
MIVVRLLAVLFAAIGAFMMSAANSDPAPRDAWVTTRGVVAESGTRDSRKLGRVFSMTLVDDEDRYTINHLQKLEGVEPRLLAAAEVGATVEVQHVARERIRAQSASKLPIPILVLSRDGAPVYDRDLASPKPPTATLVFAAGIAAIAVAALMLILSFRRPRP